MTLIQHYRMFGAYNAWANRRIFDTAAELSDADYRADRKAFFGSLHGTLNHLLVGDRIWMRRFDGQGETYERLDLVLHDDLVSLRRAREAEDARIIGYVEGLDPKTLEADFTYSNTQGFTFTQPLAASLAHFFNHQTHHRGQAHALVSASGVAPPPLDLLVWQRETGVSRKSAA